MKNTDLIKNNKYSFGILVLALLILCPGTYFLASKVFSSYLNHQEAAVVLSLPQSSPKPIFGISYSPATASIAQSLNVSYVRTTLASPVYQTYSYDVQKIAKAENAGIKIIAQYNNFIANPPTDPKTGRPLTTPVTDPNVYTQQFSQALDATHPALVVVGNEETGRSGFTTDTAPQYLQELTLAAQIAHQKGYKITDGGIANGALDIAYWDYLWTSGQHATADTFAQQVFTSSIPGNPNVIINELPNSQNPNIPILNKDPVRIAQLAYIQTLLAGYKATGIDYINFQWLGDPVSAKDPEVTWLEQTTQLPAITTSMDVATQDANAVNSFLSEVVSLHLRYAMWSIFTNQDDDTGPGLIDLNTGALLTDGIAFKTFVSGISLTNPGPGVLTKVIPGTSGVLLGIHVFPGNGEAASESAFSTFEQSIGRNLAIDSEYYDWPELGDSDNTARIQWDKQNGLLPMESWRPVIQKEKDRKQDTCASANQILSGADDAQIKQQADTLKGYGIPILLRWNYEMTDNEYNYCFNNGVQVTPSDYATAGPTYVAVWKHVHDIFTAEGATNVAWVWAPAANLFISKNGGVDATDWKLFFPGSTYIDWIANDHYNKTNTPESYATDPEIQDFYSQVSGLGKPLMQSETGSYPDPSQNPDPQTEWLSTMFAAMKTEYPAFRAMVYWDMNSSNYNNNQQDTDNNPEDNSDSSVAGAAITSGGGGSNVGIASTTGKTGGGNNDTSYGIVGPGLAAYKLFAAQSPFNVIAQY